MSGKKEILPLIFYPKFFLALKFFKKNLMFTQKKEGLPPHYLMSRRLHKFPIGEYFATVRGAGVNF